VRLEAIVAAAVHDDVLDGPRARDGFVELVYASVRAGDGRAADGIVDIVLSRGQGPRRLGEGLELGDNRPRRDEGFAEDGDVLAVGLAFDAGARRSCGSRRPGAACRSRDAGAGCSGGSSATGGPAAPAPAPAHPGRSGAPGPRRAAAAGWPG